MKMNSIGHYFENSEVTDVHHVENVESVETLSETVDIDLGCDGLLSDEIPGSVQEQMDVSDTSVEFIGELDSRKRHDIELDLHEARAKLDFHTRRQAALAPSGPSLALGEHERAARSWGYRVAKLEDELKKCDD